MKQILRHGIAAAAAVFVIGILVGRKGAPPERRAYRARAIETVACRGAPRVISPEDAPVEEEGRAALRALPPVPQPPLQGEMRISDIASESDGLKSLELTSSQDATVHALAATRDLLLEELRRNLEEQIRGEAKGSVREYSEQARKIQKEFLESVRAILLPTQKARFESLLKSGRWGRYSLRVPLPAGSDPCTSGGPMGDGGGIIP